MSPESPMIKSNLEKYDRHFQRLHQFSTKLNNKIKVSILELAFLLSFIFNFLVGRIMHLVSQKEEIYNYYNNKNNIFNQYFVKKGWGWTTLFIALFYSILLYNDKHHKIKTKEQKIKVLKRSLINYLIVTLWWVLYTQWCFGLPIMDKVFVLTGGKCINIHEDKLLKHLPNFKHHLFKKIENEMEEFIKYESNSITSYTCRKIKGSWVGGHDPSGHVFLLIHSSLYLFLEVLPFWISWKSFKNDAIKLINDLKTKDNKLLAIWKFVLNNPHVLIIQLISLWWFMLFMTNLYFHSIGEKFVGLLFGYLGIILVYYIPRWK